MPAKTSIPQVGVEDGNDEAPYAQVSERKVLIQTYDYAARTLMEMIVEGDLVLDPDYQRHYRWSDDKASKFIESVALNIPVPVVYLAEEPDGTFSVIDGQQRLTSLLRFIKPRDLDDVFGKSNLGILKITGLKIRPDLNDRSYADLNRVDQGAISKRPIRCIVVLNESDATLKFEVFERLNTGSLSLTDQEVRNCIYRGSFNTLVKRLASNENFQAMISLPDAAQNTMKDAELVLRFFAYRDFSDGTSYADSYTEYLNNYMENNREIGTQHSAKLEYLFNETVNEIFAKLGPGRAFRKPLDRLNSTTGFASNLINGAIYESQMVAVSKAIEAGKSTNDLAAKIAESFSDNSYWNALFSGTAQRHKVLKRNTVLTDLLMR